MTETSFQAARKVMQSANYLRGMITKAKGDISKWTRILDEHRKNGRDDTKTIEILEKGSAAKI